MRNSNKEKNINTKVVSDKKKYIIISVLIILTILIILYTIFRGGNPIYSSDRTKFVKQIIEAQKELSYYLGETVSDTFDLYTKEQIITGVMDIEKPEETKILDNTNEAITPLVNVEKDKIIQKGDTKNYLVINDNLKKILDVSLPEYAGVYYYIQDNGSIKVKLESTPDWWDSTLETLTVDSIN